MFAFSRKSTAFSCKIFKFSRQSIVFLSRNIAFSHNIFVLLQKYCISLKKHCVFLLNICILSQKYCNSLKKCCIISQKYYPQKTLHSLAYAFSGRSTTFTQETLLLLAKYLDSLTKVLHFFQINLQMRQISFFLPPPHINSITKVL